MCITCALVCVLRHCRQEMRSGDISSHSQQYERKKIGSRGAFLSGQSLFARSVGMRRNAHWSDVRHVCTFSIARRYSLTRFSRLRLIRPGWPEAFAPRRPNMAQVLSRRNQIELTTRWRSGQLEMAKVESTKLTFLGEWISHNVWRKTHGALSPHSAAIRWNYNWFLLLLNWWAESQ